MGNRSLLRKQQTKDLSQARGIRFNIEYSPSGYNFLRPTDRVLLVHDGSNYILYADA